MGAVSRWLDELDQHATGVLGMDEVDPGVGGAAFGLGVEEPQPAVAQDLADLIDIADPVGHLLDAGP